HPLRWWSGPRRLHEGRPRFVRLRPCSGDVDTGRHAYVLLAPGRRPVGVHRTVHRQEVGLHGRDRPPGPGLIGKRAAIASPGVIELTDDMRDRLASALTDGWP